MAKFGSREAAGYFLQDLKMVLIDVTPLKRFAQKVLSFCFFLLFKVVMVIVTDSMTNHRNSILCVGVKLDFGSECTVNPSV